MNRFGQVQKGQWRPSLIALLITLILHVGLFKVVPDELFMKQSADDFSEKAIELTLEQPDAETLQYVEANPEAPENKPDRSDNYSFRDQQAADEDPNDSQKDDMPAVAGEEASRKIVQGSIDPEERIPPESGVYRFSERSASGQDGSLEPYQATRPVLPTPDFIQQPYVVNGFSELMADVFGRENGIGVRSAVGMMLPDGIPVEVEAMFELH